MLFSICMLIQTYYNLAHANHSLPDMSSQKQNVLKIKMYGCIEFQEYNAPSIIINWSWSWRNRLKNTYICEIISNRWDEREQRLWDSNWSWGSPHVRALFLIGSCPAQDAKQDRNPHSLLFLPGAAHSHTIFEWNSFDMS